MDYQLSDCYCRSIEVLCIVFDSVSSNEVGREQSSGVNSEKALKGLLMVCRGVCLFVRIMVELLNSKSRKFE